jgi:hypothetical protein
MKGVASVTAAEAPKARRVIVFGIGASRTFTLVGKGYCTVQFRPVKPAFHAGRMSIR